MEARKAEEIVKYILELRSSGIEDEELIVSKMMARYETTEDDCRWAIEMVGTGAFRAGIISSGSKYAKSNLKVEDDPILKAAFKLAWIDFKGEKHFKENYENRQKKSRWNIWQWFQSD